MGLGVGQVVRASEDVTDFVVQTGSGGGEGDGRQVGAVLGLLATGHIVWIGFDCGQSFGKCPDTFGGEGAVDRVGVRRPHRVDAVRHGVEPGCDRQVHRQ